MTKVEGVHFTQSDILDRINEFFPLDARHRPLWELSDWTVETIPLEQCVLRSRWSNIVVWIQNERRTFIASAGRVAQDWQLVDYPIVVIPRAPCLTEDEPEPEMVVIDGNHRVAEAIERGDIEIEAFVGRNNQPDRSRPQPT